MTGLALLDSTVVSVGIDGTIRQWSLRPDELQKTVELAKKGPVEEDKPNADTMLTEEEERELAELMEDD